MGKQKEIHLYESKQRDSIKKIRNLTAMERDDSPAVIFTVSALYIDLSSSAMRSPFAFFIFGAI
jgi:hypothetical protein